MNPNLVKVFYSNMDISASKNDRVITNVFNVPTEFDMGDLNMIIGIEDEDLDIYASRKELKFSKFMHVEDVRNICKHKDFSNDICSLPLRPQYLCLQIGVLQSILSACG